VIRRLAENDDPSGFSCGDHEFDRYLAAHALANAAAGMSVTYVLDEPGFGVAGFVTLAAASIRADAIPHLEVDLPRYPLPALLVARLAVDVGRQRPRPRRRSARLLVRGGARRAGSDRMRRRLG
jgi:hypothetical protein